MLKYLEKERQIRHTEMNKNVIGTWVLGKFDDISISSENGYPLFLSHTKPNLSPKEKKK